ncbi:MAG: hypothetical protein PVJ05_12850 [Candidatus Thorarchaeota archaeon]|jgi:hypothetical protein
MQPTVGVSTIDEFPIGLHFSYQSWIDIAQPPQGFGDLFFYEFESWIVDRTNGTVDCTCMLSTGNETRIDHYQNIRVDIYGNPPLLTNITTWIVGDYVWVGNSEFRISRLTTYDYNGIDLPCYRLANLTVFGEYANATVLFYDSELGVLLRMSQDMILIANDTSVASTYFSLVHSNFLELIDVTILTTTPATATMTPPPTSSSQINDLESMLILRGFLISSIAVEIVIIIVLIRRRYGGSIQ